MADLKLDEYYADEYRELLRRLKAARLAAGLTQEEVAKQLGKTQSFISRSESGDRRIDIVELQAIIRVYGLELQMFLSDTN